jgi:hypothetical protein
VQKPGPVDSHLTVGPDGAITFVDQDQGLVPIRRWFRGGSLMRHLRHHAFNASRLAAFCFHRSFISVP